MNKPNHTSKYVVDGNTGIPIEPEKYHPNLIEKILCFFGKHYCCIMHYEQPQGRHCLKCERFY